MRSTHITVHERGENFAEVTEGTWVVGLFWERNRYEWSRPESVKATVIDSNIFSLAAPGRSEPQRRRWKRGRAGPTRGFRRGPKGRIASAVHHMSANGSGACSFGKPSQPS